MGAQLASAHSALNMKLLVVLALRPSLPLSLKPRQRLIPTTDILATAMVLATATVLATDNYYGKREAEAEAAPKAEADPYLLYGGLRTYGYGLGYYGLGHRVYYGKREAEAAPKAEADPYLLY